MTDIAENHRIKLTYTVDDDGIHMQCSCGEDRIIGYEPDLPTIALAASGHWADIEGNQS